MRLAALAGAMKCSLLLKGRVSEESFARYPRILDGKVKAKDLKEAEAIALTESAAAPLLRFCGEDVIASTLLELLALRTLEPAAEGMLELVSPGNGGGVTILAAARAAGYVGGMEELLAPMRRADEKLRFLLGAPVMAGEFYNAVFCFDEYLLGFLGRSRHADRAFSDFSETFDPEDDLPECYGMEQERDALVRRIAILEKSGERFSVLLSGERESGRFLLTSLAAKECGLALLAADHDYLTGTAEPKELMRRLVRACILEDRALVLRGITKGKDGEFLIRKLQKLYRTHSKKPLFLLTERDVKLIPLLSGDIVSLQIPTGAAHVLELWKGFLPKKLKKLAEPLASKMMLTAGQVKRVAQALDTAVACGEKADEHLICKLCYEVLDDGRYDNVKRIEPGFSLADIKIDAHNRSVLEDIVKQVELRHKVYDEWELKKRYAYGRCVSVILAGPPGTGKTMTVHALAGQLGLELYKVDLSQIVDKYIGETEKRLEEVFTRAQKSNMVLFFDEADAVMGKRSEVKDSKDKYANTEISFILQRIEEYDGIVLLATNNLQNIDQAFMRRIRYVLNFTLPDKKTREEIWKSSFGKGVPLGKDIDYDFLADKFELSGGEIKNIVLNAVFYAAAEDKAVGMAHIMKALYRENTKLKRIAFDGDYGGYAYLLHD
ncbi:MAG: ATP-binding protein [Lachnospiraceae bacterium]|nr:ATP-binding protein [Lachnospiraceae bacterium]